MILLSSSLILGFFLLISSCHLFSNCSPLLPIFLHSSKISLGISNGWLFHFNFFFTKDISSSPKGDPCEEDLPDLFGDPNL